MSSHPAPARAPGRPRSAEVDRAVLTAALDELRERGYRGMTLDGVAGRARVGKAAIYRRYRDKADLAAAAIASLREPAAVAELGDTRAERVVDVVWRGIAPG